MTDKLKTLILIFLIVVLFPFLFSTSPLPPPYHQYKVTGFIERENGGNLQNYEVNLVAVFEFLPDTVLDVLSLYSQTAVKSITDSSGYFSIDVKSQLKADSISIRAVSPDNKTFISKSWVIPAVTDSVVKIGSNQSSGCNSCSHTAPELNTTYMLGYIYSINQARFIIP